ncbi:MAG: hypothetical protein K2W95_30805 [Candidatus Obscuribacterales bacterium]|nr:hypothetical protein [Candidatus Obscuribacterales bacterium]
MRAQYLALSLYSLVALSQLSPQPCSAEEVSQIARSDASTATTSARPVTPLERPRAVAQDEVIHLNESSATLSIFTKPNQAFRPEGANGETVALGAPGTIATESSTGLNLYRGTLIVESGNEPLVVRVTEADINLVPNSKVVVEYTPRKILQIQVLKSSLGVRVQVCSNARDGARFKLKANEQLNADFIGCKIRMQSRKELSDAARNCMRHDDSASVKKMATPLRLSGSAGTEFRILPEGVPELISGQLFVRTSDGDLIHTSLGDAVLREDAVATIERWQGQLRLASFSKPDAVSYRGSKVLQPLKWGEELVVTEKTPTWGDLVPDDGVARRRFTPIGATPSTYTLAEFRLASALKNQPHLTVVRKPRTERDSKLKNQLLKTAIALDYVSGARGRYITAHDLTTVVASNH